MNLHRHGGALTAPSTNHGTPENVFLDGERCGGARYNRCSYRTSIARDTDEHLSITWKSLRKLLHFVINTIVVKTKKPCLFLTKSCRNKFRIKREQVITCNVKKHQKENSVCCRNCPKKLTNDDKTLITQTPVIFSTLFSQRLDYLRIGAVT